LVDQHRHVGTPNAAAQGLNQPPDLFAGMAIAPKKDEARRVGFGEKAAFASAQFFTGAAEYDCTRPSPRRRGYQDELFLSPSHTSNSSPLAAAIVTQRAWSARLKMVCRTDSGNERHRSGALPLAAIHLTMMHAR
jgi:hypothetical protein